MGEFLNEAESVATEQEALRNFLKAACAVRHDLDSISSRFGVSRPQMSVLYILKEIYPEGCSRGQIMEEMVEKAPDVTRLIDRLVEDGLVERFRSNRDARISMAKITEKGINLFEEAREAYLHYLAQMSRRLTKEEYEMLSYLSQKVCSCRGE